MNTLLPLFFAASLLLDNARCFMVSTTSVRSRVPKTSIMNQAKESTTSITTTNLQESSPTSSVTSNVPFQATTTRSKTFARSVFTELDAPYRLHAVSASVFTLGGLSLVALMLHNMVGNCPLTILHPVVHQTLLLAVFASVVGSITTGTQFLPKGSRFHHYREIFYATDYIMVADLMLWYWFSQGMFLWSGPLLLTPLAMSAAVLGGVKGDLEFCLTDDQGRMEFYRNGYISEEYSKPYWKYFTIIPTHVSTIGLKLVGLSHVLIGGPTWLEAHPHSAQYGSAMYMSCLLLASWSSFMQGTLTFRQAPFLGKEKFELGNDPTTWFINLVVFIPLIATAVTGNQCGALQEFFYLA